MPWNVESVDKHKEGLSESQKKRWVRIANSVLSKCKKEGKEDCEAMSIRVANSKFESKRIKK